MRPQNATGGIVRYYPLLILIILSATSTSNAATSPAQQALEKAIAEQRATYRGLGPKWRAAQREQIHVEKAYRSASANMAACERTIWSNLFATARSNLEAQRKELERFPD